MENLTTIKKMVGASTIHRGEVSDRRVLVTGGVDDQSDAIAGRWVTNSYWMAPAAMIEPMATKYEIDVTVDASYTVYKSSVELSEGTAPNLQNLVPAFKDLEPMTFATLGTGAVAYAKIGAGAYARTFECYGKKLHGLNADYADWLETVGETVGNYGERFVDGRWENIPSKPLQPAVWTCERETRRGGYYGEDHRWIPETWTPAGRVILAVLMPVRLG